MPSDRAGPLAWLAPPGRVSVFLFHRVLEHPDPILPDEPDQQRFDRIVDFIAEHFQVMTLSAAVHAMAQGKLPRGAACITFDDGYADNCTLAAPILRRHGVQGTFFVATGFVGGGRMWNDTVIEAVRQAPGGQLDWSDMGLGCHELASPASRVAAYGGVLRQLKHQPLGQRAELAGEIARRAGLPTRSDLMMSVQQVRSLREMGMEIGGHTRTHPILAKMDAEGALAEIADGADEIAQWLGQRPEVFAYPNGIPGRDYSGRDVGLVRKAGFKAAVSTAKGVATRATPALQWPRFTPWDQAMPKFALRCLDNLWRGASPTLTFEV